MNKSFDYLCPRSTAGLHLLDVTISQLLIRIRVGQIAVVGALRSYGGQRYGARICMFQVVLALKESEAAFAYFEDTAILLVNDRCNRAAQLSEPLRPGMGA